MSTEYVDPLLEFGTIKLREFRKKFAPYNYKYKLKYKAEQKLFKLVHMGKNIFGNDEIMKTELTLDYIKEISMYSKHMALICGENPMYLSVWLDTFEFLRRSILQAPPPSMKGYHSLKQWEENKPPKNKDACDIYIR